MLKYFKNGFKAGFKLLSKLFDCGGKLFISQKEREMTEKFQWIFSLNRSNIFIGKFRKVICTALAEVTKAAEAAFALQFLQKP